MNTTYIVYIVIKLATDIGLFSLYIYDLRLRSQRLTYIHLNSPHFNQASLNNSFPLLRLYMLIANIPLS